MKQSIRKLHKALQDHQQAYEAFSRAHQAMRGALDEAVSGIKSAASSSPVVTGHLGAIQKAVTMHDAVAQVFGKGHELFHDALRKAVDGLAQQAGVTPERVNPNAQAAGGAGDTGTSEPGAIEPFTRGVSAFDLQKALDRAQASMPRFGKRTNPGQRVNPNALGNPHWTGR